ncbi:hypothetical protein A2U01_0080029, partial [Trifolium medium]|nr:hypothetical protein [Trifolium medium]
MSFSSFEPENLTAFLRVVTNSGVVNLEEISMDVVIVDTESAITKARLLGFLG